MKISEILSHAESLGLDLQPLPDEGILEVRPAEKCPDDFADTLRRHKPALMEFLSRIDRSRWGSVPPEDLPLNSIMPRPTERQRAGMIDYLLSQGCNRPGPLTAWLVRRELAYYEGPGKTWDCRLFSYSAARDAACWQLNRQECEVLGFLAESQDMTKRR